MSTEFSIAAARLRRQHVGARAHVFTPYGVRRMTYAGYTASGRALAPIEARLARFAAHYANTHTTDTATGRITSKRVAEAEEQIKNAVNAGPDVRMIACGAGATAAIYKLQMILGVACPPATRRFIERAAEEGLNADGANALSETIARLRPVVFVGPYEHHSNEISWRDSFAEVRTVDLGRDGAIDLTHLESMLNAPDLKGRRLIGSFSAASNVTGVRSDVAAIARLLHRYGALTCFDYAAAAPYVAIDMNPPADEKGDASLDAVFISPHKFLGGPGSCGVLLFKESIYDRLLAPTQSGGGGVTYVNPLEHDFIDDVEEREKVGTPGIVQIIKAAMAFSVKEALGADAIEARELQLLTRAFNRWERDKRIEILGPLDPQRRIGIISFNIKCNEGRRLHPKFVSALLNDLFGIQSRAGCVCAGPYGHRLLGIDEETSAAFRAQIEAGREGMKPGWCRVSLHYAMSDADADYIINAVSFIAEHGRQFLSDYTFDLATGAWTHNAQPTNAESDLIEITWAQHLLALIPTALFRARAFSTARQRAEKLAQEEPIAGVALPDEAEALRFFARPAHIAAVPSSLRSS